MPLPWPNQPECRLCPKTTRSLTRLPGGVVHRWPCPLKAGHKMPRTTSISIFCAVCLTRTKKRVINSWALIILVSFLPGLHWGVAQPGRSRIDSTRMSSNLVRMRAPTGCGSSSYGETISSFWPSSTVKNFLEPADSQIKAVLRLMRVRLISGSQDEQKIRSSMPV